MRVAQRNLTRGEPRPECAKPGCSNQITGNNQSGYCANHRHEAEEQGKTVTLAPEPEWRHRIAQNQTQTF